MNNQCYEGVNIPVQIQEPCGNTYISTNCVTIPSSIVYLDLPAGSKQTEVNANLVLALQTANALIQNLIDRLDAIEG